MKLATVSYQGKTTWGIVADDGLIDLGARSGLTLKQALEQSSSKQLADKHQTASADFAMADASYLPPIIQPGKITCIGVNYINRNAEYADGSAAPKYPSVFMRTAESLVGHNAAILRPPESEQLDYEGEIVIVVGRAGRRIPIAEAHEYIAGLTLMNEGSVRDWLRHGKFNVTQGKNFFASGSIGPWIVTADEIPNYEDLSVTTEVNGEMRQQDTTANLAFPFAYLLNYLSTFMPLQPGDIIATGTPSGAGVRMTPPLFLQAGDEVCVSCPQIGKLSNTVTDEVISGTADS